MTGGAGAMVGRVGRVFGVQDPRFEAHALVGAEGGGERLGDGLVDELLVVGRDRHAHVLERDVFEGQVGAGHLDHEGRVPGPVLGSGLRRLGGGCRAGR